MPIFSQIPKFGQHYGNIAVIYHNNLVYRKIVTKSVPVFKEKVWQKGLIYANAVTLTNIKTECHN
jgi:hypothetical protein